MMSYLLVFLGGGIGAALRHGVNRAVAGTGAGFPVGTLLVNVVGSLIMGLIAGWLLARGWDEHPARLFLTTGLMGGFTTFSAFSHDAVILWQRGATGTAAAYVAGSVVLSILALLAGLIIVRLAT
jgi:fluoride exporter